MDKYYLNYISLYYLMHFFIYLKKYITGLVRSIYLLKMTGFASQMHK